MKLENWHHLNLPTLHIAAQSVGQTTVNGTTIASPWLFGDQLAFIVNLGAQSGSPSLTLTVQVQKISDSSWVSLVDSVTGNTVAFTPASLAASTLVVGTLRLPNIDSKTYKAVRLAFVNATGASTALIGVTSIVTDLFKVPSGTTDGLAALQFAPTVT